DLAPERVPIVYGAAGKPRLGPVRAAHIDFNLSHSGEIVVLVFSRVGPVGIDVEQERPELASNEVIETFFSDAERTALRSHPADEQAAAFFQIWTRKEAAGKALGLGIPDPASVDSEVRFAWFDLELPSGYQGAVAWLPMTTLAQGHEIEA